MRFEATLGKEKVEVAIERDADRPGVYRGSVGDGPRRTIDLRQAEPGVYSLLIAGQSHEVAVRTVKGKYLVSHGAHTFEIALIDARLKTILAAGGGEAAAGEVVIESPMPGRVVAVKGELGAEVQEGEGVIIIEAMKMENELQSPKAGRIKEVCVKSGETVEAGQKLIVIE